MRLPSVFVSAAAALALATPRLHAQDLPNDIHWVRDAAEHDAIFLQVYRAATARIDQLSAGLPAGSWAVILDADETVLDNSDHFKQRALAGLPVTPSADRKLWLAWAREVRAPALPGAGEFIAHVTERGGRVVIVTNREEEICEPTRENLRRLRIAVDAVLCRPDESGDKNPRYDAVQEGTTGTGLAPLKVLMWVGDNIQDFPHLTQQARARGGAGLREFGTRFFLLPNPIYGSWEGNPAR